MIYFSKNNSEITNCFAIRKLIQEEQELDFDHSKLFFFKKYLEGLPVAIQYDTSRIILMG